MPLLTIIIHARFEPGQDRLIRANFWMQHLGSGTPQQSGHLLLEVGEWQLLGAALGLGADRTGGQLVVDIRTDPLAT